MADIEQPVNGSAVPEQELQPAQSPEPKPVTAEELNKKAADTDEEAAADNGSSKPVTNSQFNAGDETAFPALGAPVARGVPKWGDKPPPANGVPASDSPWKPAVKGNIGSERLELASESQRKEVDMKKTPGATLGDIMKKTGARIEYSRNSFIISGTNKQRSDATTEIYREFTKPTKITMAIPSVLRGFVVGKQGATIKALQQRTQTNVKLITPAAGSPAEDDEEATIDVLIEGDPRGVDEARRTIGAIISQKAVKVTRRITNCPGQLYPFVAGPFKKNVEEWEQTVDKVYIPEYVSSSRSSPFDPADGPIEIVGNKAEAEGVKAAIEAKIQALESACYTSHFVDLHRFRHRLLQAGNQKLLNEFLDKTGCSVILPKGANVDKVMIYGDSTNFSPAAQMIRNVVAKLPSYDLGRNYPKEHARNLARYLQMAPEVRALESEHNVKLVYEDNESLDNLESKSCHVSVLGKIEEASNPDMRGKLERMFQKYTPARFSTVQIEPLHQKHIAGKDGKGVAKYAQRTSVQIILPTDQNDDNIILVYTGEADEDVAKEALDNAVKEVAGMVEGQASIIQKAIQVPKAQHPYVQGERGTTLNALKFGYVNVQFGPSKGRNSDVSEDTVIFRGAPSAVDTTITNVKKFLETCLDGEPEMETIEFTYPQEFMGNLIGAKGANLNKLRDEFGVDVRLKNNEIKGIKVCAEAAAHKLNNQIKELRDKATIHLTVPPRFHKTIIGSEGATVKKLEERYKVHIMFPKKDEDGDSSRPKLAPNEIIVKGPKKGAEDAAKEITDLYNYEEEQSFTGSIKVKSKAIGTMFRTAGKDIKNLRDDMGPSGRINFPQENKDAPDDAVVEITIRGTKDSVANAKAVLTKIAKAAEASTSRTITVDKKFHRALIGSGGSVLKGIVSKAGGPEDSASLARMIRFPDQKTDSNEITIQGDAAVVDKIIASIEAIVETKQNQITETFDVIPEKHRLLIGREGSKRKELERDFDVSIEIPRQRHGQKTSPTITITGKPEAVEKAKAHISEIVKDDDGEVVEIPRRLHHAMADSGIFTKLREIKIRVEHNGQGKPQKPLDPKPTGAKNAPLITDAPDAAEEKFSWEILEADGANDDGKFPWVLHGTPENITKAKAEIEKAVATAEKQGFVGYLILPDPTKYRFVVGHGGSKVNEIRRETGCRITVPRNNSDQDAIVLHGSRKGLEKAKDMILSAVKGGAGGD